MAQGNQQQHKGKGQGKGAGKKKWASKGDELKGRGKGKTLPGKAGAPVKADTEFTKAPFEVYLARVLSWRADSNKPSQTGDRTCLSEVVEPRSKRPRQGGQTGGQDSEEPMG